MVRIAEPQLVEALSGRSKCQACGELITFREMRVGMPAKHNGVSITKWLHPPCFARHGLRCDYAPTDRAHCSGDGSAIRKGEPRLVMFLETCDKVVHQKLYKPPNAAAFLRELFQLPSVGMSINAIEGLDAFEAPHRTWVEAALSGAAIGPTPIRDSTERYSTREAHAATESLSARAAASSTSTRAADPLFLDGCTIRVMWPQRYKGRKRERCGRVFYRPWQPRRKRRNAYVLMTQRRSGGVMPCVMRERRTSGKALCSRELEVLSSPREAPRQWSKSEVAAARLRRERGESVQSVALALGRSMRAVENQLRRLERSE